MWFAPSTQAEEEVQYILYCQTQEKTFWPGDSDFNVQNIFREYTFPIAEQYNLQDFTV